MFVIGLLYGHALSIPMSPYVCMCMQRHDALETLALQLLRMRDGKTRSLKLNGVIYNLTKGHDHHVHMDVVNVN